MDKRAKITEIIRQVSKKPVSPQSDESLFDSGLLDSFALPDMVTALEQAFAVSIPDSDLNPRKFDTIERIESYLDTLS
jgi:D-alanine--poly(phosphoribitol) ligase subunit 2